MQLRDYQVDLSTKACDLLTQYKIAYLSMQVRTGKTLTALNTCKLYGAKNVLFVTKKKATLSVVTDYEHYKTDFKCFVINFEQLHNITEQYFDLVIIDEAHSTGAYATPSKRTKELKRLCHNLPIIYLSGTPSPESYSQLYHQFWISSFNPFTQKNFYTWAREGFVTIGTKYVFNRQIHDYDNANKEAIDKVVGHLFLPYTQQEAGFEQLVDEHIHQVEMSDRTYQVCNKLRINKVITGKNGDVIEADTEVKLLSKLHQLYSGTIIFDVAVDNSKEYAVTDDSKVNYIFNTFKGLKFAVFYKFKAERLAIIEGAEKRGLKWTESPEEFQTTEDIIFLSQFVSGREGVNLSTADCLVCYNIDFSAVTYFQVRARLQSKDRVDPAKVHWIFAKDGIEERIYKAVCNKKNYTTSYFIEEEKARPVQVVEQVKQVTNVARNEVQIQVYKKMALQSLKKYPKFDARQIENYLWCWCNDMKDNLINAGIDTQSFYKLLTDEQQRIS
ncbi:MAG: hypothetical protein EBR82_52325 [Caulobacteraceae bacterium]|nr:hypothetical protein [Caulobacteraceae bacterium]